MHKAGVVSPPETSTQVPLPGVLIEPREQNHKINLVGKDLGEQRGQPVTQHHDANQMMLRRHSLNICRDGASTTSWAAPAMVNDHFAGKILPHVQPEPPLVQLSLCPLVLRLVVWKSPTPAWLHPLFGSMARPWCCAAPMPPLRSRSRSRSAPAPTRSPRSRGGHRDRRGAGLSGTAHAHSAPALPTGQGTRRRRSRQGL